MTLPVPKVEPADEPAIVGPYDAAVNGRCALGHPVNGFGRCAVLNDPLDMAEVDLPPTTITRGT